MRARVTLASAAALTVLTVLTGCSDSTSGQPTSTSTPGSGTPTSSGTSTTATAELPTDGAPKVTDPLQSSKFQHEPCQALSTAQLTQLNVGPQGKTETNELGESCTWQNAESHAFVILQTTYKDGRGLSSTYKANDNRLYEFFNVVPQVSGFPAVTFDQTDGRKTGRCSLAVGVADNESFNIGVGLSFANAGKKDPCQAVQDVTAMMLETMKAGG